MEELREGKEMGEREEGGEEKKLAVAIEFLQCSRYILERKGELPEGPEAEG